MEKEFYTVLIADDEYWTREKLRTMIDWPVYSLRCLEPAANGEEVVNRLKEERPDILITDINMPFVNGVQLLQMIQENYPDIITFVVSGYDDFQYVKDSFMAGSINYLVKPIARIDLVNALSKALEIISLRQADARHRQEQQTQLLKAASLLQDREFSQLLERENASFTPIITMNNDMDFAGMSLMLIKIHDIGSLACQYGHDMNQLSYAVKKEIRRCLNHDVSYVFNYVYRPNEFAVLSELDSQKLAEKARYMLVQFKSLFQSPVTMMLSSHSYSLDSIHDAYIEDISMLMTRVYAPEDVILLAEQVDKNRENQKIGNRFTDGQVKELREFIRRGSRDSIENLIFHKVGLAHCAGKRWEYLEVRQTVKRILNTFSETLSGELGPEEIAALENMVNMSDRVIERLDEDSLCDAIRDVIDFCMAAGYEGEVCTTTDLIRQAAAYVDENYNEDLSLSSLAKRYGVESTYFSRIFRQETGENLMAYITRKRMEKAVEYMKESVIALRRLLL